MIGRIHLHEAADQMRAAAHHRAHRGVCGLVCNDGGLVAVVEQRILAADLQDVGMLGRHPEGVETLDLGQPKGIVGAKPGIGVVNTAVRIGGRVNQVGRVFVGYARAACAHLS